MIPFIALALFAWLAICWLALAALPLLSEERDRQDTQALRHAQDRKKETT